ncbi:MAG: YraN family protein [Acidimicrobiales bacterium]|nr:YraN family protein [Acidimicrobiales bacterium]
MATEPRSDGRGAPRPYRQRLGARGEQLAADWYVARGYEVVVRNWRCRDGELDLVVARKGELVFCEVKTRSSDRFGVPAEAVTRTKQRRLRVLAARFLAEHGGGGGAGRSIRFDVAAVMGGTVEVIEAAF